MVLMRRVLAATLIALVALAVLLAGTGVASAQDQAGGLDGQLAIAPSRPGDHAVYALHLVRMDESGKGGWAYDAGATFELERMPDRVLPTGDGGQPEVLSSFASTWTIEDMDWAGWAFEWRMERFASHMDRLDEQMDEDWGSMDEGDWEQWGQDMAAWGQDLGRIFDDLFGDWGRIAGEPWHVAHVDGQQRVAATTRVATEREVAELPSAALAADLGLEPLTRVVTLPGPSSVPCGFHSSLQGSVQDLSVPVRVAGACPPVGGHFGVAPANLTSDRYVAVGHDVVQGRPATVFAPEWSTSKLRLWFAEDAPYPVRLVVPVDLPDGHPVYLLYEMTSLRLGSQSDTQAPTTLDLAPRQVWGPDATDVEHPFPLPAALAAAQADFEHAGVRDWLATHPGAFVDAARFAKLRTDDGEQEQWRFTFVSGPDALDVTATRGAPYKPPVVGDDWPEHVPPVPPRTLPPPIDDGVGVTSSERSSAGRATSEQAPLVLPRVADLLAAWQADGSGGGTPAWSYQVAGDGGSWVAAGTVEAGIEGGGPGEGDAVATLAYSLLGAAADGSFLFMDEKPSRYRIPEAEDPDAKSGDWDPEDEAGWRKPSSFGLAAIGYWTFPEPATAATVTAAAGILGIVAYALLPAKFGALGLFSRIRDDDLLDHPLRRTVHALVEAEPGIHFQEIVRRVGSGRGTVEHHLRKLVAAGLVSQQASQGFTCYFAKGRVDRRLMAAAPALKANGARLVLQAIHAVPGRAALDVAQATGFTPSTVNYHLKRLVAGGLVEQARAGRYSRLGLTPLGQQALGAWGTDAAASAAA